MPKTIKTSQVDNIIAADLNTFVNGDSETLNTAKEALIAFTKDKTSHTSFHDVLETADRIGNQIVKALKLAEEVEDGSYQQEELILFANYALDSLAREGLLQTTDVDNIIAADLNNGDDSLHAAYRAINAFADNQTFENGIGNGLDELKETAGNIGNQIVKALKTAGEAENAQQQELVMFANHAAESLARKNFLETADIGSIIAADLNNGDHSLHAANVALSSFARNKTFGNSDEILETAGRMGNQIAQALRLAEEAEGDSYIELLDFATFATFNLAHDSLLETKDVGNIIAADLHNGDNSFDTAYDALNAFKNGKTFGNPDETIKTADKIGNQITKALKMVGETDELYQEQEMLSFAYSATNALSQMGMLSTTDVDNIIYNDLINGDNDLTVADMALDAFINGQTFGDFDDIIETAQEIVRKVDVASNRSGEVGAQFAEHVADLLDNYVDTSILV